MPSGEYSPQSFEAMVQFNFGQESLVTPGRWGRLHSIPGLSLFPLEQAHQDSE